MISNSCAGFDQVDTDAAQALGLTVARVPAYRYYKIVKYVLLVTCITLWPITSIHVLGDVLLPESMQCCRDPPLHEM